MLNKKEIALINSKIDQYRKWAKEEETEARREMSKGDHSKKSIDAVDEHFLQARLNESAADTLELLLTELLPS